MANAQYFANRRKYHRPQAVAWSNNPGTLTGGIYVPTGQEVGADPTLTEDGINEFLILSDHNRSELSFTPVRIQQRQRMINGNMRSYFISDKLGIATSWSRLPSRPYSKEITFDPDTGDIQQAQPYTSYTVDGAAGGVDMLSWYESHPGPFYCYLAYDKYRINDVSNYNRLNIYNQILKVYFSAFSYNVEKRSNGGFDFWNVNMALEEV